MTVELPSEVDLIVTTSIGVFFPLATAADVVDDSVGIDKVFPIWNVVLEEIVEVSLLFGDYFGSNSDLIFTICVEFHSSVEFGADVAIEG